jgi:hypothetical protein
MRARFSMVAASVISLVFSIWVVATTINNIFYYHHALPYWDGWATVIDYQSITKGTYPLTRLFSQHNEHRIAFPRIFEFADFWLFSGRGWFPVATSLAMQVIGAFVFVWSSFSVKGANPRTALSCMAIAILFCSVQTENLSEQFQLTFTAVWALSALAIYLFVLAVERHRAYQRAFALWLASTVSLALATYSAANGFLAGIAILGVALLMRAPKRLFIGSAVATAFLAASYLHGYVRVAYLPSSPMIIIREPLSFATYIAAYLGSPALGHGLWTCVVAGIIGLVLGAAAVVCEVASGGASGARATMVGVMIFALLTAVMTAVGRTPLGLEQAMSYRYTTFGLMLWAALVVYWLLLVIENGTARLSGWAALGTSLLISAIVGWAQTHNLEYLDRRSADLRLATVALMSGVEDDAALHGSMEPQIVKGFWRFLRDNNLSVFAAPDARMLGLALQGGFAVGPRSLCSGSFDSAHALPEGGNGTYRVKGWAWNKRRFAAADRIFVIDKRGNVVGYAAAMTNLPDVAAAVTVADPLTQASGGDNHLRAGWTGFATTRGGGNLRAFARIDGVTVCEVGDLTVPAH